MALSGIHFSLHFQLHVSSILLVSFSICSSVCSFVWPNSLLSSLVSPLTILLPSPFHSLASSPVNFLHFHLPTQFSAHLVCFPCLPSFMIMDFLHLGRWTTSSLYSVWRFSSDHHDYPPPSPATPFPSIWSLPSSLSYSIMGPSRLSPSPHSHCRLQSFSWQTHRYPWLELSPRCKIRTK